LRSDLDQFSAAIRDDAAMLNSLRDQLGLTKDADTCLP
jgi:hypothetical protein